MSEEAIQKFERLLKRGNQALITEYVDDGTLKQMVRNCKYYLDEQLIPYLVIFLDGNLNYCGVNPEKVDDISDEARKILEMFPESVRYPIVEETRIMNKKTRREIIQKFEKILKNKYQLQLEKEIDSGSLKRLIQSCEHNLQEDLLPYLAIFLAGDFAYEGNHPERIEEVSLETLNILKMFPRSVSGPIVEKTISTGIEYTWYEDIGFWHKVSGIGGRRLRRLGEELLKYYDRKNPPPKKVKETIRVWIRVAKKARWKFTSLAETAEFDIEFFESVLKL
jgi:hypothetical protein